MARIKIEIDTDNNAFISSSGDITLHDELYEVNRILKDKVFDFSDELALNNTMSVNLYDIMGNKVGYMKREVT
tara:strand:+ start:757 stop:975 length:219 start_codon:yes stop_codon:yes gene_type:complete